MYISLWENSRGHPDNISFMQFSTKIDGFEQKDSQGFENSYNSYEQYPLEKFFIFTIYQNYTLALKVLNLFTGKHTLCNVGVWLSSRTLMRYWETQIMHTTGHTSIVQCPLAVHVTWNDSWQQLERTQL